MALGRREIWRESSRFQTLCLPPRGAEAISYRLRPGAVIDAGQLLFEVIKMIFTAKTAVLIT